MKKITNPKLLKSLKVIHLICAFLWMGSACAMVLLLFVLSPTNFHELYMRSLVLKMIDDYLIIPGANGCLLTGIIYGLCTNWGFFRHRWLVVKWVLTIFMIASGTFAMGPCVNGNVYPTEEITRYTLDNAEFFGNIVQVKFWGIIQLLCLLVTVIFSVYRPFKKKHMAIRR